MKQHELARALRIPSDRRRDFRQALRNLAAVGKIVRLRKSRWGLPEQAQITVGTLSVHPDGFGFVSVPESSVADIFIPARHMGTALHGDEVQVALAGRPDRPPAPRERRRGRRDAAPAGPTGRIVNVLRRRFSRIAGVLKVTPYYRYVIPDHPRIRQNVQVQSVDTSAESARDGHRVVLELMPWSNPDAPVPGRLIEDLGPADAPGVDMLGLLRSHSLSDTFPDAVLRSARAVRPCKERTADIERRDLRGELLFTIDPEDARDFDDAVSLRRLPDGGWELSVHIADVSAYVQPGDDLDREAMERGTSVYLVDRVISMLPRDLTEDICSLVPGVDRFAYTVRMQLTARGRIVAEDTFPSWIRSSARLAYDQVQQVLDNGTQSSLDPAIQETLLDMARLADVLRRKRRAAGSILFEMPEVRCMLDSQGQVLDIVPRASFDAYHLIEEFMLLANRAVARRLTRKGYPAIWRVHEPPDDEQWERIHMDLAALDIAERPSNSHELNAVAESFAGTPMSHIVNLAMLRNLKRAEYASACDGHFGLSFAHYLHFTSPIRRYPDLVVHRILKALDHGTPPPSSSADLARIADHCSRREREADEAEMRSVDMKRLAFYTAKLARGETGPFQVLVTGVQGRGVQVELTLTLQRGFIPFSFLRATGDAGRPRRGRPKRTGTRMSWRLGDVLDVELVRIDTARSRLELRPSRAARDSASD